MSDKTYDVKIYEVLLKSIPGTKKFRFEIFWVEKPEIVFRCDIFSNENQDGCQMIIEKINIKTLLGKTFRLFVNQKVPGMGVIRGKILGLFP